MRDLIEGIKKEIELTYNTHEQQEKNSGVIRGNAPFDLEGSDQDITGRLEELRELKSDRDKVYSSIKDKVPAEDELTILNTILTGFNFFNVYYDDANTGRRRRLYRDAKTKIEEYVKKQNDKLISQDPHFKILPIRVEFIPHIDDQSHLIKRSRPKDTKNDLIEMLSNVLEPYFPEVPARSHLISDILRSFYGRPSRETDPRSIRKHF